MTEGDKHRDLLRLIEDSRRGMEDVLAENQALREKHATLQAEVDAMRSRMEETEADNRRLANRHVEIEQRNGNLASLYVASYNLHATLDLDEVIRCIKEILINLIGAQAFGLFAVADGTPELSLIAHEGLEAERFSHLRRGATIDEVLTNGAVRLSNDLKAKEGSGDALPEEPIAFVPLKLKDQQLGIILIYQLLDHLPDVAAVDRELLELLSAHAATALYAAQLYTNSARKLNTLESFLSLLRAKPVG